MTPEPFLAYDRIVRPSSVRRTRFLLAMGVLIVAVLFLVLRGGGDRRSFTFGPSSGLPDLAAVAVVRVAATPSQEVSPALTVAATPSQEVLPALAREAERIAASDTTLARLVRLGNGRRQGNVTAWYLGSDRRGGAVDRRGGAVLEYKLERPIAVNSDLPYVAIPPDAPAHGTCVSPYAPGWAHLSASRVTQLSALVDLRRHRVVDIGTNAKRGRVSPVAGKPYPTCNEVG
jgi:hypothetical protein